jgi:quercetin dioxygenase-like cupin family protein
MRINRGREATEPSRRHSEHVTGLVWSDAILIEPEHQVDVRSVFFAPRARTVWHRHSEGQVLCVTHGRGRVGTRDGGVPVGAGDVVFFAPGEDHWHGGGPDTCLVHLAVTHGEPTWLEEVGDRDYEQDGHPDTVA